ncbi:hypothetical protein F4Y93_05925 [Candidatus Poribacteria bacterium]|nr:hypothetical protein [Candidatus Poribacteria bacterium]
MAKKRKKQKVRYPVRKKRLYATGKDSLLDLHRRGKIMKGSLIIGLYIEKRSHWDKGRTFRFKRGVHEISEGTGYSTRHVYRCIDELKSVGWMRDVSPDYVEWLQFEIAPFGAEARAVRETTAAPLDTAVDPLSKLAAGLISRAECIAWHYVNVDWQERLGETIGRSLRGWSEEIGLSARTLWSVFKESDLLARLSTTTHQTVLKVFPFLPNPGKSEFLEENLSESEIQSSYSEVVFKGETAHYRGEEYRSKDTGYEKYDVKRKKWFYISTRVPAEVKDAFGERMLAALATA